MVSIVSASYGGYDQRWAWADQTVDVRCVRIFDDVDYGPHPRLIAKGPKLRPWDFSGSGPWIWIDAAFEVVSATFVAEVLTASEGHPISQWAHPWRDCVYAEAEASTDLLKYIDQPIRRQADHYRKAGHPPRWGLWCTGLIVYRQRLDDLADAWMVELERWGYQDQISQPVALRNTGFRPHPLPYGLHADPWLRWHPHRDDL